MEEAATNLQMRIENAVARYRYLKQHGSISVSSGFPSVLRIRTILDRMWLRVGTAQVITSGTVTWKNVMFLSPNFPTQIIFRFNS